MKVKGLVTGWESLSRRMCWISNWKWQPSSHLARLYLPFFFSIRNLFHRVCNYPKLFSEQISKSVWKVKKTSVDLLPKIWCGTEARGKTPRRGGWTFDTVSLKKKAPSSNTGGKRAPQVTWESEDLTGPQCALCLRGPCVSACVNGGLVSSWPSTMQTMHPVNGYEEMDDAFEHKALGGVKPTNPAFFPFSAANAW